MSFISNLTIAIPVYERFDFFKEAIESVLDQTAKCNILVVDNYSSHDKFEKYVEALELSYVKYYRNAKNEGMVGNWNRCIELCNSEWLSILHDDDWLDNKFCSTFKDLTIKFPDSKCFAVHVYASVNLQDFKTRKQALVGKTKWVKSSSFYFGNLSPFPGVVFNTNLARKVHGFNVLLHPISDYDLWYKLSKETKIMMSEKFLAFYRLSFSQGTNFEYVNIINKMFKVRQENLLCSSPSLRFLSHYSLYKVYLNYSRFYNNTEIASNLEPVIMRKFKKFEILKKIPLLDKVLEFFISFYL